MEAHTSSAGVQQTGCRALRKLASNNEANQASVAHAGGIEAAVSGMRAHRAIVGVEKEGGRALTVCGYQFPVN